MGTEGTLEKIKNFFLRSSRKWTDIYPVTIYIILLIQLLETGAIAGLNRILPVKSWFGQILNNEKAVEFLLNYYNFIGLWIVSLLLFIIFKANRPMLKGLCHNDHGNTLAAIPAGILLGGGMNGLCILISWIRGDISLTFNEFDPVVFSIFFICVLIQSGAEEVMCRLYHFQKLRRRYRPPVIAILGSSLLFSALHLLNPVVTRLGLLQIFLIGILFSLIVYYFDSMWTVIWAHAAWNFSQSIVFGLPNSGVASEYSVFVLDQSSARNGFFYDTGFGVEGSLGGNLLILAAIAVVLIYAAVHKCGECHDYWRKMEEECAGVRHRFEPVVVILSYIIVGSIIWGIAANFDEISEFIKKAEEEQNSSIKNEMTVPDKTPATAVLWKAKTTIRPS